MKQNLFLFFLSSILFCLCINTSTSVQSGFSIKKSIEDYLQEYSKKPILSIGTEHFDRNTWIKTNILPSEDVTGTWIEDEGELLELKLAKHKMLQDNLTHQGEYVINNDQDFNPDLCGSINDVSVQEYLLQKGRKKFHLIWEEYLPFDVFGINQDALIDMFYNLLSDNGYLIFKAIDEETSEEHKRIMQPFIQKVTQKFGVKNVKEYPLDEDAYEAKNFLPKNGTIWIEPLPTVVKVPIFILHEKYKNIGFEALPESLKEEVNDEFYKFDQKLGMVYEPIIINSIDRLKALDAREAALTKIYPLIAKYQTSIIVAQKMIEKTQKQPEIQLPIQIPIISEQKQQKFDQPIQTTISEKPKKVSHWWDKMKQYITMPNVLQIETDLPLPIIFYLIYKKYHKK